MIKRLRYTALALLAAAVTATAATTQTNVLQNINFQLTFYQQGPTNSRKVLDKVTSFTTKNLITALGLVTTNNFGPGAKLVLSTVFSNVTIDTGSAAYSNVLSTNLALPTNNSTLIIGGGHIGFDTDTFTIIGNQLTDTNTGIIITINGEVVAADYDPTNENVTINTNAGFKTTLTPSTNIFGQVTNVAVLMQQAPTLSIFTNVSSSIDILYGLNNTLYPVTNYLIFSNSPTEIVVKTGSGLDTTNANLVSQIGFSIQGLTINYAGPTNLTLNLQGFVKQALKVDTLYVHGKIRIVADIFGASSTWNVIGSGYTGGIYLPASTTNVSTNVVQMGGLGGFLTNASPIVVEGAINVSFLKNLAQ
jgi:hypothetical protein